jgi:eukaryotic-like serine/threonine-protein kinase
MSRPLRPDDSSSFDTDDLPTVLQGQRPDRTALELDDPEPTIPPEPIEADSCATIVTSCPLALAGPVPAPPRLPLPAEPARIAGRYELEQPLGQGAFGRVFAARDTRLGRRVAIKLLHPEYVQHPEIRQRFLQEAHAAACIGHPGIVTIFDVGDAASPYIAMELLEGESLQARVARRGPLAIATAREVARQVAAALAAAHRSGVIHRDLKPENIFLVADPAAAGGERVKVLDFGLAKPTLTASVKTRATTVFGTPLYMGPEQFERTPNTDMRSDIYALGCVLYQLVIGRPPFEGTLREVVTQHQWAPPPSLRDADPAVPLELDEVVRHMLAKDPRHRPQTMDEVERALRPPAPPTMPRSGGLLGKALAVVGLVLAAGLAVSCASPIGEPARATWSSR